MTALDNDAALRSLNFLQFPNIQALQQSPEKMAALEEMVQNVMAGGQQFPGIPDMPVSSDSTSKAVSSSSGSVSPRDRDGSVETETEAPQPVPNPRQYRQEPWHECFTTTKEAEFEALIYSVYVTKRDDKKLDGCEYYDCHNRLQSKCRYKVRTKKVNEFFIVEEKGAHNHAMEPVGSPGSHAGLPKTLREIVDTSFYSEWPNNLRQQKIEEEIKRLGLPHNPRLGRQIDNRIAYLRRVKNLSETRKNLDQANGMMQQAPRQENVIPNGGNPEELLKLMLQSFNGMPLEEGMSQLTPDSLTSSQLAISPQMIQPPVSQPQIIVHENNNEILKVLAMQNKDLPPMEQPNQAILNMLMSNNFMPPATQETPMETQDSSSSSNSPEDRLQIED